MAELCKVMAVFCRIDDKQVPLYWVLWVADVPHFCGAAECEREGQYEVRLAHSESVWASRQERDATLAAIAAWQAGGGLPGGDDPA